MQRSLCVESEASKQVAKETVVPGYNVHVAPNALSEQLAIWGAKILPSASGAIKATHMSLPHLALRKCTTNPIRRLSRSRVFRPAIGQRQRQAGTHVV